MKATRPRGKRAIAAAIRRLVEEQHRHRSTLAMVDLRLSKLGEVAACIANEIAAASAANVAELTALRQEVAACFRPGEDSERRVIRRLP